MACSIHKVHVPMPLTSQWWTKPDGSSVEVCPTGYENMLLKLKGMASGKVFRGRPGNAGRLVKEYFEWIAANNTVTEPIAPPSADTT